MKAAQAAQDTKMAEMAAQHSVQLADAAAQHSVQLAAARSSRSSRSNSEKSSSSTGSPRALRAEAAMEEMAAQHSVQQAEMAAKMAAMEAEKLTTTKTVDPAQTESRTPTFTTTQTVDPARKESRTPTSDFGHTLAQEAFPASDRTTAVPGAGTTAGKNQSKTDPRVTQGQREFEGLSPTDFSAQGNSSIVKPVTLRPLKGRMEIPDMEM
jgi:hypothetical protein